MFENQRVLIDGFTIPEKGYQLPIVGPELGEGVHHLTIALENNSVVVNE